MRGCLRAGRQASGGGVSPPEGELGGLGWEEGPSRPVTRGREDEVWARVGVPGLRGGGGSTYGCRMSRVGLGEGRRGSRWRGQEEGLPGGDCEFPGSLLHGGGIFCSNLQLLEQTRQVGGISSRKLPQPPLCWARSHLASHPQAQWVGAQ